MPLTIRTASLDDLPAILKLEQQTASAAHWSADEYHRLVKAGVVLLAEREGSVCAFVCATSLGGEWEIENIVVATEFLRQGIADRLIRALIEQAEKGAASRIMLEVRESNRPARRLYEKHGFCQTGSRHNYYKNPVEDAILYQRPSESPEQL